MNAVKIETRVTKVIRQCVKTIRLRVSAASLIDLLNHAGFSVPPDAEVTVEVPSGGDYSGMNLDLRDVSIKVMYTEGD